MLSPLPVRERAGVRGVRRRIQESSVTPLKWKCFSHKGVRGMPREPRVAAVVKGGGESFSSEHFPLRGLRSQKIHFIR